MKTKLCRGQKLCKSCQSVNAARQRVCKTCGMEFVSKNTPIKNEIKNWKELENGVYIKVIQGTGPYFVCKKNSDDGLAGDRVCVGITGVYKVVGTDDRGIKAYGATPRNRGFAYLYMGPSFFSNETGFHNDPYRIKKVKFKNRS